RGSRFTLVAGTSFQGACVARTALVPREDVDQLSKLLDQPMRRRVLLLSLVGLAVMAGTVMACSVPVFQYAFEHWKPDPYQAIVFHRGDLNDVQREQLTRLRPARQDGSAIANLEIKMVNLDAAPAASDAKLWAEQGTETLPWLVVTAPPKHGPPVTVWSGEFNPAATENLVTSPVRRELEQRLLNDESVVWIQLDSGNGERDDAAHQTIQAEVARLEQVVDLPEIDEVDLKDLSVDPAALKFRTSALRVSRDDPAERFLIEMLLSVEADLRDDPFVQQPMAFPVFGRGRVLYALVGDGIAPGTMEEACRFLVGGCQCTVKAQNPGVDLLTSADWDQLVVPSLPVDTKPPTLTGLSGFAAFNELSAAAPSKPGSTDESVAVTDAVTSHSLVEGPVKTSDGGAVPATPEADDAVALSDDQPVTTAADSTTRAETTPVARSLGGSLMLVMGLLAMCVLVASMVLMPRSR
ncbi:MAG: hypothetical protein KF861_11560, partial [Planctomycetaceae bacterium]|nr:hypothetical protein [Planctomycetaceae bacterium]